VKVLQVREAAPAQAVAWAVLAVLRALADPQRRRMLRLVRDVLAEFWPGGLTRLKPAVEQGRTP
jgi:hypothetical protein